MALGVTPPPPPRKPQGWPIQWSDLDMELLSQATPQDAMKAAALWRARAPKALKDLLDAVRLD